MFSQGKLYYQVRWKGFGPEEDTWEPEENLFDCSDVLDEYWNKSGKNKQSRVCMLIYKFTMVFVLSS